jgi:N-acetylglucosaminyl-diphospho-decaprenol L-rhamnosyltransferase
VTPDVRVGIVSWNTAALLDACLASLPAALDGLAAEVVVVDNASDDASAAVAARHTGVRVVANRANEGYARAMNRALADTSAPVLVALNPDTVCPPGSLAALVGALLEHPDAGVAAPRLCEPDGSVQHSVYRFPSLGVAAAVNLLPGPVHGRLFGRRLWLEGHAPHDRPGYVDWAVGAVHAVRAAALGGEPPYRERWFMYVEDLDLCWRLARRGWRTWFAADVAITHVGNASGARAWGPSRTERWLAATYDWYRTERGVAAARAWAALNLTGCLAKAAGTRLAIAARLPGRPRRDWWYAELRRAIPVHARALIGTLDPLPPPSSSNSRQ